MITLNACGSRIAQLHIHLVVIFEAKNLAVLAPGRRRGAEFEGPGASYCAPMDTKNDAAGRNWLRMQMPRAS